MQDKKNTSQPLQGQFSKLRGERDRYFSVPATTRLNEQNLKTKILKELLDK